VPGAEKVTLDVRVTGSPYSTGLAHVPLAGIVNLRGRHVFGVTLERAAIDPLDDDCDLLAGERRIVFEVTHAGIFVNVPGRHFARGDLLLNRFGPWPCPPPM
jgi:hypothetical protein